MQRYADRGLVIHRDAFPDAGPLAGVFAGLSMAVFGGLLDLAKLSRSVSLSVLPIDGARLLVALSAGLGALAARRATRRSVVEVLRAE